QENFVSGVDTVIGANLATHIAFRTLLTRGIITEEDAERIIERASYAEDKTRLAKWLSKNYSNISEVDRKYICSLKVKDFGRLSRKFLAELEGVNKSTGEVTTIIGAMWNTQNNLMEIIADEEKYNFAQVIRDYCREYYNENNLTLAKRLDNMYISNAVRRPIYRTLDIVRDVVKAFGKPEKIFIEMARGGSEDQKGKRTKTRKQQILELYDKCKDEEVRLLRQQLEALGDYADNKLQGDQLFLYFMQLGKSMYSNTAIELDKLGTEKYNVDHIYPQAFVKDDSVINNKVLVLSTENGAKKDDYPIASGIQQNMRGYWDYLHEKGLISDEKYKRLIRVTPFSDDEKLGFINRQLTETSQSTKAVAELLKEKYPETEIVYCKARLVSEFRQEFELYKSRTFNDLHHAVDAYLNIVVGNVYHMKFSKRWFSVDREYSLKTKPLFTHPLVCGSETVWGGEKMLAKVKKTAVKNNAHFTKFAFFKKGGLFDQMPVSAAEGLVPLKKGLPTEKYGGYNKASVMFYIPVRYKAGKKSDIIIMSVELLFGKRFLEDSEFAEEYTFIRIKHILGKDVDEISFPMGMRPWKVNTVLSLDGFRVCIAGTASRGKCLIAQPIMQFSEAEYWKFYLKKLEEF
ncbi:MAG: type II CRISPR RNA-guided endonuclease Cas9, partial [Acutalibacteraceae bacterium]